MLHVLDKIRGIILKDACLQHPSHDVEEDKRRRRVAREAKVELIGALSKEILERVGDGEKEAVMRWWYANLGRLEAAVRGEQVGFSDHVPTGIRDEPEGNSSQVLLES